MLILAPQKLHLCNLSPRGSQSMVAGPRSQSSRARIATRAVSKPWDYRRSLEEVETGEGPAV